MYNRHERIIGNLRLQLQILDVMRQHHLGWADAIEDPETASIHAETAKLIGETTAQYSRLLDQYDTHAKQDVPIQRQDFQSPV
jgi:hypothetical protein